MITVFCVQCPDRSLMGPYESMLSAQQAIADREPDPIEQNKYQIHPITPENRREKEEELGLRVVETWTLEKFDGEYVGQSPAEVIHINP